MLRLIDNSTLRDRRHIKDMLEKHNLPSMNQLAAQIKLTEAWKSINKESFLVKLVKQHPNLDQTTSKTRSTTTRMWNESARTMAGKESFVFDAAKLWNSAPKTITEAKTLCSAKNEIKRFCRTLPV